MIDYGAPALQQRVFFERLTRGRSLLGNLDGVRSARRERNIYASPRTSAAIELTIRQPLDTRRTSIRMWVEVSDGRQSERHALFTGIPRVSGEGRGETGAPLSLKLMDYSSRLDVPLGKPLGAAQGTLVTSLARQICESVGAWDAVITESSFALATDRYWPAITTKRQLLSDILAAAGYSAAWADEWGRLRIEPYIAPGDRPVRELGFIHGETCTYKSAFTIESDVENVPNHVVISARTPEPQEPIIGEAWLPPEHPLSMESQELEVPYSEDNVDVDSSATLPNDATAAQIAAYRATLQAAANAYAQRALETRMSPTVSYVVENRWRPSQLHDVAAFYAPARGPAPEIDRRVSIAKDSLTYNAGDTLQVSTTLQEVR